AAIGHPKNVPVEEPAGGGALLALVDRVGVGADVRSRQSRLQFLLPPSFAFRMPRREEVVVLSDEDEAAAGTAPVPFETAGGRSAGGKQDAGQDRKDYSAVHVSGKLVAAGGEPYNGTFGKASGPIPKSQQKCIGKVRRHSLRRKSSAGGSHPPRPQLICSLCPTSP